MKILFIINVLSGGGRERRMIQLIKSLSLDSSYKLSLVVLSDKTSVDYSDIYETKTELTFLSQNGDGINYKLLDNLVHKFAPNIVHCWCMNSRLLYHLVKLRIHHRFKLISGYVADGNKIPLCSTEFITTHASFMLSDCIISNSKAGLIAKNAPLSKSVVIYNGFDYNRFGKDLIKSEKRKELGLDDVDFVISMFARFSPAKDWESFIECASLLSWNKRIKFMAVGKGENLQTIIDQADKKGLNNIMFLGFRSDVEDLIRISDLTMLWSNDDYHAEGVSNSIMESMAAGVPVIASKGGGTCEIIDDKVNGYVVLPKDTHAAVNIIKALLTDTSKYYDVCSSAKTEIENRFLLSHMAHNYKQLYVKLLNQ